MIIQKKVGNIFSSPVENRFADAVTIEWYETGKRILHKQTNNGTSISLKFLNESPDLKDGDILWQDDTKIIVVEIKLCETIVIKPRNIIDASSLCYEIGNRHLPLFYEAEELVTPYESPLYNLLLAAGYKIRVEERKLNNPFKTSVLPHVQVAGTGSLFKKIAELSTTP